MQKLWRSVIILLALFSSIVILSAQDETETLTVVGSGIVNPAFESVVTASETELTFDIATTGTSDGLTQLCAGTTDISTASRSITAEETVACSEAGVEFFELLVGYDLLAIVSNPADSFALCLTTAQLDTIFAPSSAGTITNWNQLNPDTVNETDTPEFFPDAELQVFVPEDTTLTYAELDTVINGVGFRSDATTENFDTIIESVLNTPGSIGAVPYEMTVVTDIQLTAIEFRGSDQGCLIPDIASAEDGFYPASVPLFVYVNKTMEERLGDFLPYLAGEDASNAVVEAGFSPATIAAYETNAAILAGEEVSQTASNDEPDFQVPPNVAGAVTVGGATTGFSIADATAATLTASQPNLTITRDFSGTTIGITSFCNGELDILFVNGDGTVTCEGETPETVVLPLGNQSAVLVSNAGDDHTACLTTDQIQTIWGSASTETVTQWNHVAESMPEQAMTLFGIRESSDVVSDIMLTNADGIALPVRVDTEINFDPLYRAAAVANVPGAITYMRWSDFERVLENGQTGIQLVLVDGGNGCTQPSVDTITGGQYPLTRQTTIVINKLALADIAAQSYTWTLFSDTNLAALTSAGFVGIDETDFANLRETLFIAFTEAMVEAAEAAAEATPEVTPEATDEVPEATEEAGE